MKYLDFGLPEDFIHEVKEQGISEVRLGCFTKGSSYKMTGNEVPCKIFMIVATATKKDLDFVIRYEEIIGDDITYFNEKMKELATKTDEREKHFKTALEDSGLIVKKGIWGTENHR